MSCWNYFIINYDFNFCQKDFLVPRLYLILLYYVKNTLYILLVSCMTFIKRKTLGSENQFQIETKPLIDGCRGIKPLHGC